MRCVVVNSKERAEFTETCSLAIIGVPPTRCVKLTRMLLRLTLCTRIVGIKSEEDKVD